MYCYALVKDVLFFVNMSMVCYHGSEMLNIPKPALGGYHSRHYAAIRVYPTNTAILVTR